jgi:hypothetical protein
MRDRVVMIDAGYEVVLATVLVLGWMFGSVDGDDFPSPASSTVTVIFGVLLWMFGLALASAVSRGLVSDGLLRGLAIANLAFAALLLVWVLVADGFSTTGLAVTWTTIVVLALLAASELLLVEPRATRRP